MDIIKDKIACKNIVIYGCSVIIAFCGGCECGDSLIIKSKNGYSLENFVLTHELPYTCSKERYQVIASIYRKITSSEETILDEEELFLSSPDIINKIFKKNTLIGYHYNYIAYMHDKTYLRATYMSLQFSIDSQQRTFVFIKNGKIINTGIIPNRILDIIQRQ